MANTYTQLHIQLVFAVKFRMALIHESWEDELQKYITGIIQGKKNKMLQVNNMPDHIHLFFGMRPDENLSGLVQVIKSESSKWINDKHLVKTKFAWQGGFGAFSYSKSHVPRVINYVKNQKEHHQRQKFLDEYKQLLTVFDIQWDERYIFKEPG